MTKKRDTQGKLRDLEGKYADDKAETGVALTAPRDRGPYAADLEVIEAHDVVIEAFGERPGQQMSDVAAYVCIAATCSHVSAAAHEDRARVLRSICDDMDKAPFIEAQAGIDYTADTATNKLSHLITATASLRGAAGTPVSEEGYAAAVREAIPVLRDREVDQAVSDFSLQPHGYRLRNIKVMAAMGERSAWINSEQNRIPAPPEYPFLSVPGTATIAKIDLMLMDQLERTSPEEIARELADTGWGSVFLEGAARDRIGQLRPELRGTQNLAAHQ